VDRVLQNPGGVFRGENAKGRFGHRLEHAELVARLVQEAEVAIEVRRVDLAGEVKQRGSRGQRLDHPAACVCRGSPGARHYDAQAAGHACIGVGHADRARFAARRHEPYVAAPVDRIEDRHVVDRDDAKRRLHPELLEIADDEITDRHAYPATGAPLPSSCTRKPERTFGQ
jgi:hypothetical protein